MAKKKRRRKTGMAPGTLIFTGKDVSGEPNVSLMQFNANEVKEYHLKDKNPPAAHGDYVTWFDIRGVHDIELIEQIGKSFVIHPLVLEDILDIHQRPKFEDYENGFFITLRWLKCKKEPFELETEQVSMWVGQGFLLSFQELESDLLPSVRERINNPVSRIRQRGSDYLAYALLDTVVDHYYLALDEIEERIDQLEEEVLGDPGNDTKAGIHQLKVQSLQLRKSVAPLREAIARFSRAEHPYIQEATMVYVRDLFDHVVQIMDTIDTYRDMINGLYDLYLSEISFRMNNVMKVLTIISTIFIPLTFLAGIYGMNFEYMPELKWHYGYFGLWALMLAILVALVLLFRKQKWL